jgi:hypothetical protein
MVSGTLVFLLGIAANELITYVRVHSPRKVRWNTTGAQHNYTLPSGLPLTNVQLEVGITDDGYLVWRPSNQSNQAQTAHGRDSNPTDLLSAELLRAQNN